MKKTLWTRNFTLLILATTFGSIGGIAGNFALSFLVFDETGSTLASALILAAQFVPGFLIPMIAAPLMDRLPRKPFLVGGDAVNGLLYVLAGVALLFLPFSYLGYLAFSLVIACLQSFDGLAYNAIYPKVIPEGMEQKGYSVSGMLYPVLQVVMMPVAAVLLDSIGVGWILIAQGGLSILAALTESNLRIQEENRMVGKEFSFRLWWGDIREGLTYMKQEPGLMNIYLYSAVTNGIATACNPLMVAFFHSTPGFNSTMYSFFSVAEFAGRSIGGVVSYRLELPPKKRFGFAFFVYLFYQVMDALLLWLPYPLMLVNRAVCGFLGINSATVREAAVQRYLPDALRARISAFEDILYLGVSSVLILVVGALGELLPYRVVVSLCAVVTILVCWLTNWRKRRAVKQVFEA